MKKLILSLTILVALLLLAAVALGQGNASGYCETVEAASCEIAYRVIQELWNGENIDVVDDVYAESFLAHSPDNNQSNRFTPGFWRDFVGVDFRRGFPDMVVTINFISATEDFAVVHYTFEGTFMSALSPAHPATGRSEKWDGIFLFRFENGRIVEEWWYWVNSVI